MTTFLSQLDWRFATKSFDATKTLSPELQSKIEHAIQMAPSSFGLQPFHVVIITDPKIRAELREASYSQPQVAEASALFIFCARTDANERIDSYLDIASGGKPDTLARASEMMKGSLLSRGDDALLSWASRQAYIALGFGLAACAELGVDSCPMEGFDAKKVDEILGLPSHIKSLAYMAVGYRKEGPTQQKVRFPESDLFTKK